ncbi:hypothetical protein ACXN5S_19460, partial [Pseudoroseicyclus sp. H15]
MGLTVPTTGSDPKVARLEDLLAAIQSFFDSFGAAIQTGAPFFDSVSAGIAGVADGAAFSVFDESYLVIYRRSGSSAVELGRVPSSGLVSWMKSGQKLRPEVYAYSKSYTGALSGDPGTVGGVAIPDTARLMLAGRSNPAENGPWKVNYGGPWTRPTDMNSSDEVPGATYLVENGDDAGNAYGLSVEDEGTFLLGTDDIGVHRVFTIKPLLEAVEMEADARTASTSALSDDIAELQEEFMVEPAAAKVPRADRTGRIKEGWLPPPSFFRGQEVLIPAFDNVPPGWHDTGERLLSTTSARAFLSNWQPSLPVTVFVFDDTSLLFQDAAETVPVAEDGDPVAVAYAKVGGGAISAVAVTNSGFASDLTGWTVANGSASATGGKARIVRTSATSSIQQAFNLTKGIRYIFRVDASWVAGVSAAAGLVLRDGAAYNAALVLSQSLAAGASGELVLDYTPDADETVYLHLSVLSASGTIDFENVAVSADTRLRFATADTARRPTYRTDGSLHWLEFDGINDALEANIYGIGLDTFDGAVWASYRPLDVTAGYVWNAGPLTADTTGLVANVAGDFLRVGGNAGNVMDAGAHDKVAVLSVDRGAGTGSFGRDGDLAAVSAGTGDVDWALTIGARIDGSDVVNSPQKMRLYGIGVAQEAVSASVRDRVTSYFLNLARYRPPRKIYVILVSGQSNADG